MASFYKAPTANFFSTTLNGSIDASVQTITLNSVSGLQSPGVLIIDREDANGNATPSAREFIAYTGISGNDLTGCTRAFSNSSARSHSSGALVEAVIDVTLWNDLRNAVAASLTTDGTGVALSNASVVYLENVRSAIVSIASIAKAHITNGIFSTATINALTIPTLINASGASVVGVNRTDGWIDATNETWTYASAQTFTIAGVDLTTKYTKGTRLKFTQTTVKYAVVVSSTFSTNTTVTIATNTDYTIANAAITGNYYSYEVSPQGYPTWFNFTSTYGAPSPMSFTSVVASYSKFKVDGQKMLVKIKALGITGGSAGNIIAASLPLNPVTESYQNVLLFNTGTIVQGLTRVDAGSPTITMQIVPVGNFSLGANTGILGSNMEIEI